MNGGDPYRTPGEPTQERKPAGQCPRCGEDIWDLAKWKDEGHDHAGCMGDPLYRVIKQRDEARAIALRLQEALDRFYSYTFKGDTAQGFFVPLHVWDELSAAYLRAGRLSVSRTDNERQVSYFRKRAKRRAKIDGSRRQTLMQHQHAVSRDAGFLNWTELIDASPEKLQVAIEYLNKQDEERQ